MKYIKTYERDIYDLNVNTYVKIKDSSPFFELANNRIFKIQRKDNAFFFLLDIYGNIPDVMSEISKPNVRLLTAEEQKELNILLSQNKYNL